MLADLVKAVDRAAAAELAEKSSRSYLGASGLGKPCIRQVWYDFRWAYRVEHGGRLLRLLNRGHEEEDRFYRWLRAAGVEVRDYQHRLVQVSDYGGVGYELVAWDEAIPDNAEDVSNNPHHIALAKEYNVKLKQYGFIEEAGHIAGHTDGQLRFGPELLAAIPGLPEGWGLAECKTHNDKSFKQLEAKGVITSKPQHYVQMQCYMHKLELPWALYCAVNKNDDNLYFEIIRYKKELAEQYFDIARKLVYLPSAPKRLTEDPSWFECKFCDFREICHYGHAAQKNCRSCIFSETRPDGTWYCTKFHQTIPKNFIPSGCGEWESIS
jgi:hypothetical protein